MYIYTIIALFFVTYLIGCVIAWYLQMERLKVLRLGDGIDRFFALLASLTSWYAVFYLRDFIQKPEEKKDEENDRETFF